MVAIQLPQAIAESMAQGYRVTSQTPSAATMVKPKKISLGWLIFWCCTLVGWIPYLGYHFLMKRERTIQFTESPQGDLTISRHAR